MQHNESLPHLFKDIKTSIYYIPRKGDVWIVCGFKMHDSKWDVLDSDMLMSFQTQLKMTSYFFLLLLRIRCCGTRVSIKIFDAFYSNCNGYIYKK